MAVDPVERVSDRQEQAEQIGSTPLEISNAVVRIHKEAVGRGPTKARTQVGVDLVTVVLEGGFTRAEQTLRDSGADREVQELRSAMQSSIAAEIVHAVESITGRRVRSFMSASDPDEELQVEVFVLFPPGAEPPPGHEGPLASRARRTREQHREVLDEHRALRAEQGQARHALRETREAAD